MSERPYEPREQPPAPTPRDPSQPAETPEVPLPPPPTKRVGQRVWLKALLLLGIFISGAVVGGGVAVISVVRTVQHNIEHPELRPQRWTRRVTRRLDLNAAESQAVQRVFIEAADRLDGIQRDVWPRLKDELDRVEREVGAVLPPHKAQQWRKDFNQLRDQWVSKPPPPEDAASQSATTTDR